MQITELHYRRIPTFDYASVKSRAQEILGSDLDSPQSRDADKGFLIFHKAHPVKYKDGEIPAQTAILATDQPLELEKYGQEIQQSWRCREAEELLGGCKQARLVMEMMARPLPPQDRVLLFHGVLRAMIEITSPDALVFSSIRNKSSSQRITSPRAARTRSYGRVHSMSGSSRSLTRRWYDYGHAWACRNWPA
jgi:hypothetical protein